MAINYSYPDIGSLTTSDRLLVIDTSNNNVTKTTNIGSIVNLVPDNTLQEVLDAGNTATQNINLTGQIVSTSLTTDNAFILNDLNVDSDLIVDGLSTFNGMVLVNNKLAIGTENTTIPSYGDVPNLIVGYNNNINGGPTLQLRNTKTITSQGDTLGRIQFTSTYVDFPFAAANVKAVAAQNASGGASGGAHIIFETSTGLTAAFPTERMRITNNGNVSIGNTNDTYKLDVTGAVNATSFKVQALNTAPLTATSAGTTGEIRYTSDYIYVCVATNTWKRTPLSTW